MEKKQILILVLILGALTIGIVAKSWIQANDFTVQSGVTTEDAVLFQLDPAKVERILIGKGPSTPPIELFKEKDLWRVKSLWGVRADAGKVKNLLEKLQSAKGELRGTQKKLFSDFGIRDEEALSIIITDAGNKALLDLRVGIQQAGMQGCFLRKAGSEEVYLSEVNVPGLLGIYASLKEGLPLNDYWADVTLFNLQAEKVQKITVHFIKNGVKTMTAGVALVVDSKDTTKKTWSFLQRPDKSSSLDPEKVTRFIATLNSIKAIGVADPNGKNYGLENPSLEVAVTEGDEETVLSLGAKDEKANIYFVKLSNSTTVFTLTAYYFEDLGIDDTRFLKEPPPPAADSKKSKIQERTVPGQPA